MKVRIDLTPKEAEVLIDAIALLDAEIDQNELGTAGGRGQRELDALQRAKVKLYAALGDA